MQTVEAWTDLHEQVDLEFSEAAAMQRSGFSFAFGELSFSRFSSLEKLPDDEAELSKYLESEVKRLEREKRAREAEAELDENEGYRSNGKSLVSQSAYERKNARWHEKLRQKSLERVAALPPRYCLHCHERLVLCPRSWKKKRFCGPECNGAWRVKPTVPQKLHRKEIRRCCLECFQHYLTRDLKQEFCSPECAGKNTRRRTQWKQKKTWESSSPKNTNGSSSR